MDFMFRIPRWVFSIFLLLGSVPITFLLILEVYLNYGGAQGVNYGWINSYADELLIAAMLGILLALTWMVAVIFRTNRNDLAATLLALPSILSLVIVFVSFSAALHDLYQIYLLPSAVFEYLNYTITLDNIEFFLIGSLALLLLSLIIVIFSLIRFIGKGPLSIVVVPLQVILLPIGILWLQPKLLAATKRKPVEQVEEHLLE